MFSFDLLFFGLLDSCGKGRTLIFMKKQRIAFVDPGSFVLVHDKFFLNSVVECVDVDFYYSMTKYNMQVVEEVDRSVNHYVYAISSSVTNNLFGAFNYLRLLLQIFIRRKRYRYIHFNWSLIPIFDQYFLPFIFGEKLIYSMHNFVPHDYASNERPPQHVLAKRSSKVVVLCDHVVKKVAEINPNTFLLQHGLTIMKNDVVSDESYSCYFVGNVKPYKGISSFIDLAKRRENKNDFYIYGRWQKDLADEKRRAERCCVVEDEFLSETRFNSLFLGGGAIFVLPYQEITQSGIMYNVIAGCSPFIASNRGEFSDLAEKIGFPELLFEPGDIDAMEASLLFCMENSTQIKVALKRVQREYSWEYSESILRALYAT